MNKILAEAIIIYRSKFEQQTDEGFQELIDLFASFVVNHPYSFAILVFCIIVLIVFLTKKFR